MEYKIVKVPNLGVNDDEAVLVSIDVENNQEVKKGDLICSLETTKTAIEIESPCDGYVYFSAAKGDRLSVGEILALVTPQTAEKDFVSEVFLVDSEQPKDDGLCSGITKKAELLAKRNGLDLDRIREFVGEGRIKEADVIAYQEYAVTSTQRFGVGQRQRIGIIGGVSGGGALIVIDSILRTPEQQPSCIFDENKGNHGKSILGVPVVGGIGCLDEYLDKNEIDAVVIAFNRNLAERGELFERLDSRGVAFCNVIDPSVEMRSNVVLGKGNVILGKTYLGACTSIGDNNFISSNVCLEHGNILGSHCGFGPGVMTSGNVTIGDRVRFATGIYCEPGISIGDESIISSGAILRSDVASGAVVRVVYAQEIKSISPAE